MTGRRAQLQNQPPVTHTQAEPAPVPYVHCPNTDPQLPLGAGLVTGQPAVKQFHCPLAPQLH